MKKLKNMKSHNIVLILILLILLCLPLFNALGTLILLRNENANLTDLISFSGFTYSIDYTLQNTTIFNVNQSPFYTNINDFLRFFGIGQTLINLATYWFSVFGTWLIVKIIISMSYKIINILNRDKE